MSMVTRCPSCNTVFRVTPQQLQAHNGDVRCGRCMMVFDGFKGLAVLPEPTAAESEKAVSPVVAQSPTVAHEPVDEKSEPFAEHDRQAAAPEPGALSEPFPSGFEFEPDSPSAVEAAAPESERTEGDADSNWESSHATVRSVEWPASAEIQAEERTVKPAQWRSWLWTAGGALLLLLLLGQASYYYRVELAASHPALKSILTGLCNIAGCDVPLPQRPKLIYIEASDMQVVDSTRPDVIRLTATLRNHAGYDVAFPALDLVLTNARDHSVARRIFMPGEYLDQGKKPKSGIPANGEVTFHLDLDIGNLDAAGFRLDLLAATSG